MAHELKVHYERWKALRPRAPGMGAFHDFAVAAMRANVQQQRARRGSFGAVCLVPAPEAERAVERWYGEGGNTQTRAARRGRYQTNSMHWERIQVNWPHFKLSARSRWGRLTDDELDLIAGRRELLVSQIRAIYQVSRDMAHLQVEWWQRRQREPEAARG